MGVIMQTFYWDCPKLENQEYQWWNFIKTKLPSLSQAGFTALWLPPLNKAGNVGGMSMGYDPYDYYDLGEFDQKGTVKTWFGSKAELADLINVAHQQNLDVYADLVINHNNGGDAQEVNPLDGVSRWTKFNPGSGKFLRDWRSFHPSQYETWDQMSFGEMPDLCHRNPDVYAAFIEYTRWLVEEIDVDGFRYDFVKGYGSWMVRAIQELRGLKNNQAFKPFGVGECWDSDRTIADWLAQANTWSDNPVSAFDFPLRYRLRDLCQSYGFSLKTLCASGTLLTDNLADLAVTFVENHDVVRNDPIKQDKILAYAFILTHEGYPCVFWEDYYNQNLSLENTSNGIAALVKVHEIYAGGSTKILYADDNLYIMQRSGWGDQPGLIFVLNNLGSWNGTSIKTQWANTKLIPVAWNGSNNPAQPEEKLSDADGSADLWAPGRGYTVFIPSKM